MGVNKLKTLSRVKSIIQAIDQAIFKIEITTSIIILVSLVLLVSIQVFNRYILKQPLSWSEELSRLIFTFLVFMGMSAATKVKAHFGIEYFKDKAGPSVHKVLEFLCVLSMVVFLVVVLKNSLRVISLSMTQKSSVMGITIGYVYFTIPLFCGGSIMHIVSNYLDYVMGGEAK